MEIVDKAQVPRDKIYGLPTKLLLNLYNQKKSRMGKPKDVGSHSHKKSKSLAQLPDLSYFADVKPIE